jgi:hypothetical protein
MQDAQDVVAESLVKSLHGVASSVRELDLWIPKLYQPEATPFSFVVAAMPR